MSATNIAEAKARLSELIDASIAGEEVTLLRRGKPVARIVPIQAPRRKIDAEWLKAAVEGMPFQEESSADLIRRMRDESY